jgi:hypothetical protein
MNLWDALDAVDRAAEELQGLGSYFDELILMLAAKRGVLLDMSRAEGRRMEEDFKYRAMQDEHQFQAERAAARAARTQ